MVKRLITDYGVATIPLSAFYTDGTDNKLIRLSLLKMKPRCGPVRRHCVTLSRVKSPTMKMKITALTLALGMMCTFSAFAAGELRYGVEAEYPPFESRNTAGELEGFDIDLGNAICKAAQLKCSWVETSFDALIPGLVAKKFDAINSAMNITEQRRKSIDFTQPIYRIPRSWSVKPIAAWRPPRKG
jgi:hypothetical protein